MSKLTKLSDLCIKITDGSHYSPQGTAKGYPMLSSKDMQDYDFDFSQCKYISEDDYTRMIDNDCKPLVNDVLIIKDGNSYLQKVFVVREERECAILSSIGVLRPDTLKLDPYYLKYYLSSDFVKREVAKKYVTGSALPRIILKNFGNIEIPYIDIKSQEKVVSVLKLIDLKIENNNKINMELESMEKTIYDYWFLQFEFPNEDGKPYKSSGGKMVWNKELKREIPDRWRNGTLEDLGEIIAGGTPSTNHPEYYSENGIAWITPNDLSNSNDKYITHGERDISEIGLNNSSARLMPEGTVLLTSRAPIGYLGIAANEVCTNQGFKSIVPNEKFGSEFIYHTVENMIVYLKSLGTGSTFTEISKTVVASVKIAIPEESVVGKFEEMVSGICAKHRIIERENKELISLRDFLLPLLMNGQVGFKN